MDRAPRGKGKTGAGRVHLVTPFMDIIHGVRVWIKYLPIVFQSNIVSVILYLFIFFKVL